MGDEITSHWQRLPSELQRRILNESRYIHLTERLRVLRETQRRSLGLAYRTQVASRRFRDFRRYMRERLWHNPSTNYAINYNMRIRDAIARAEELFNLGRYSGMIAHIRATVRRHP